MGIKSFTTRLTDEEEEQIEVMEQLILLSQLGLTKTRYTGKGAFTVMALQKQARQLYLELRAEPALAGLLDKVLRGRDIRWLADA